MEQEPIEQKRMNLGKIVNRTIAALIAAGALVATVELIFPYLSDVRRESEVREYDTEEVMLCSKGPVEKLEDFLAHPLYTSIRKYTPEKFLEKIVVTPQEGQAYVVNFCGPDKNYNFIIYTDHDITTKESYWVIRTPVKELEGIEAFAEAAIGTSVAITVPNQEPTIVFGNRFPKPFYGGLKPSDIRVILKGDFRVQDYRTEAKSPLHKALRGE